MHNGIYSSKDLIKYYENMIKQYVYVGNMAQAEACKLKIEEIKKQSDIIDEIYK